jgi:hypothetical protein
MQDLCHNKKPMKPAKEEAGGTWKGSKLFHIGTGSCTNMEQKSSSSWHNAFSFWWISEFSVIIKLNERTLNALKHWIT